MKILFHNYYQALNLNNQLFELQNAAIGDDLLKPFNLLAKTFKEKNIVVGTFDKIKMNEADAFVFIDYPKANDPVFEYAKQSKTAKLYLLILESPIVNFDNFDLKLHGIFEKIFTWSDDLVQSLPEKYIKIQYSYCIPDTIPVAKREKLCTIISGNKLSNQANELYHERLKCIKWYEKNATNSLDLYGTNWDIVKFENDSFIGKWLNKINGRLRIFKYNFSVYKGKIDRKNEVLKQYNFCICFENVANYNGYITEKIFDCFFAGTIPIYKGANNILEYVPQNCFIDYDKFKSIEEMHTFMQEIPEKDLQKYRENIIEYLKSEQIKQFGIDVFCNTLTQNIQ